MKKHEKISSNMCNNSVSAATNNSSKHSITAFEAIQIARKYNLEYEIRQELASGLTPEEALDEWDIR